MLERPNAQNASPPPPREAVRRMTAYTPGEQPKGRTFIKLNTNEFPYPPAPEAIEAARRAAGDSMRLYPNPASAPLREAIAERCAVGPDSVFVGNGSDEVLRLMFQTYLAPGEEVAVADPTYSLYPVLAAMFEARLIEHPTDREGRLPDSLFAARPRLFVIANPNPPLGALYAPGELARLAEIPGALLLIDEAYVAFAPRDCLGLVGKYPNVVISRTFSKSHGLAGMRVGYAVAHPEVIRALDTIRDSYNVNRVSQSAALAAFEARDYYAEKAAELIASRERLRAALIELGYRVPPSAGNFLFARSGDGRATLEALRERGFLVRYFDHPALHDGVRITIGAPEEIDRLIEALQSIPVPQEAKS